jgi:short-subunit dehydrogenase
MKILITGASSGLGAEFARQYASPQNHLILLARRADKLYALRKELYEKCQDIDVIVADVTEFESLENKLQDIENLDILLLNAGISLGHKNDITPIAEFKKLYDVNLLANHAILELLLPKLVMQKQSKIVFISSLASLVSFPSSKVYSSSKRALNAYAEGIRYKYTPKGIKVITLLPGFIKSELTDKNDFNMPFLLETDEGVSRMINAIEKGKSFYPFPFRFYLIIKFFNLLPSSLSQRIVNYIN